MAAQIIRQGSRRIAVELDFTLSPVVYNVQTSEQFNAVQWDVTTRRAVFVVPVGEYVFSGTSRREMSVN